MYGMSLSRSRYNLDAARILVYARQCTEFVKNVSKERVLVGEASIESIGNGSRTQLDEFEDPPSTPARDRAISRMKSGYIRANTVHRAESEK